MGLFSRLFGRTRRVVTTDENPLVLERPTVGFLNLQGEKGASFLRADRNSIRTQFHQCVSSDLEVLPCPVLFLYCDFIPDGHIAGTNLTLPDVIAQAQAYIAIVASHTPEEVINAALGGKSRWTANIAITLNRKDDKFAHFYTRLFHAMNQGTQMLMAWVQLAPQIPGYDHSDCPDSMMTADAGPIAFSGFSPQQELNLEN